MKNTGSRKSVPVRLAIGFVVLLFAVTVYAATGYYTRQLVTLNCPVSISNVCSVSAPSVPKDSKITKVTFTGSKSGANATVCVKHVASGKTVCKAYSTSGVVFTEFNGLTPDTKWEVWITCSGGVTTITNGQLRVDYEY